MIFDSHAHYDDDQFNEDRHILLSEILPKKGVNGIINCSSTFPSIAQTLKLCKDYSYIYGAVGIHPECANELPENYLEIIKQSAKKQKVIAIGEIGLDYYYEHLCPREKQKEVFIAQLELAKELDLPVILHDREAHADMLEILKVYKPRGVMHCFSGSAEMAREVIKLGLYIGLGGVVTFKNAKHSANVAKEIPLERLLLETDCPYLSPVPFRGKRNDSSLIAYTASKIAELRETSADEILKSSEQNIKLLFNI